MLLPQYNQSDGRHSPSNPDRHSPAMVLVANDQEWAARSFETILVAAGHQVVRAYTGRQALQRVETHRLDAIILDAQLPDLDGADVCHLMRQDPRIGPTTPIMMTTAGPSGRQERHAAYRAGAWEFFGFPLDSEGVLLKLRLYLDAKQAADAIRDQGLLDEATGLYNGPGLRRRGLELAAQAARHKDQLSCVLLRPAAPGEPSTANVLAKRIGEILRESVRLSDVIGRFGPLQFAVLAVSADGSGAARFARRVSEVAAALGCPPLIVEPSPWPFEGLVLTETFWPPGPLSPSVG